MLLGTKAQRASSRPWHFHQVSATPCFFKSLCAGRERHRRSQGSELWMSGTARLENTSAHVGIRVGMVHRQGRHHEAQIWTCCVCNLLPNPKRHARGCFWRSLLGDAGNGREGSSVAGAEAVGFALPRMATLSFRTKAVCRCKSATIEKYSHMPIHVPAAKPSCLRV